MNRRLAVGLMGLLIAALLLPAGTAQATIFSGLLTANRTIDPLANENLTFIVDNPSGGGAGVGVLSDGDYLVGIRRISTVNGMGTSETGGMPRVYMLYTAKIDTDADNLNGPDVADGYPAFTLTPVLAADPQSATYSLKSMLTANGVMPSGGMPTAPLTNAVWDQSIFAILETPSLSMGGPGDPWADTASAPMTVISRLSSANGYFTELVAGIATGSSDFMSTRATNGFYNPLYPTYKADLDTNGDGVVTIAEIEAAGTDPELEGTLVFEEKGGYTEFWNAYFGYFDPITATDFQRVGFAAVATTQHEITIKPTGKLTATSLYDNWSFESQSVFQLNHMPEPAAIVMLFGLAAMVGLGAAWRKRKA